MLRKRGAWAELAALAIGVLALAALAVVRDARSPSSSTDAYSSTSYDASGTRAWYEMLARMHVGVDRFEFRMAFLNEGVRTLVLVPPNPRPVLGGASASGTGLNAVDLASLRAWIRSGGRAVIVQRSTALLESVVHHSYVALQANACPSTTLVTRSTLGSNIQAIAAGCRRLTVAAPCDAAVADELGAVVVRCPLGRGEVLALTDPAIIANSGIGKADNARLAYALIGSDPGGLVAFDERLHGFASGESWWQILPSPMRWALVVAGVAVAVFLFGRAVRLGPAVVQRAPEAASIPFVDVVADLYAAASARVAGARLAIDAVMQTIGRHDDPVAQAARKRLQSLEGDSVLSNAQLIELIREVQTVRNSLSRRRGTS